MVAPYRCGRDCKHGRDAVNRICRACRPLDNEGAMNGTPRLRLDLRSLLLGLAFGFGTNLVTANPENWPEPLQVVDKYAPFWLISGISITLFYEAVVRVKDRRHITWRRPDSPYAGLAPFTADRSTV